MMKITIVVAVGIILLITIFTSAKVCGYVGENYDEVGEDE